MKKINLWPMFLGSLIAVPVVVTNTTHYGWTLAWCGLCLLICAGYEIYYKLKHKKI